MVDQLALAYAAQPVVFLEYPVTGAPTSRSGRFWAAHGGGVASYPLIIVDSGHQVQSGVVPYYNRYKSMVDQELVRAPQADILATRERLGDKVRFVVQVKNRSATPLAYAQNKAAVHALVYEDIKAGVTSRYVRSAIFQNITTALAPGASAVFTLETSDLVGVNWDKLHYVALVDYQPAGAAYDMLQAAVATPAVSADSAD